MPAAAVVGVASIAGSVISSRSASKAANKAASAEEAQLAFAMEQYDDWQNVFGPIQDNLSNYYQSLTPDYYEAAGLEAFQKERDAQLTQLRETLAQRGLATSGVSAALERSTAIDTAQTRANIRREAPSKVAEEKGRFLQIGMGQNPGASYSSALSQITQGRQQNAMLQSQAAGAAIGNTIGTIGTAISDYMRKE